jgi:hypothetical protein
MKIPSILTITLLTFHHTLNATAQTTLKAESHQITHVEDHEGLNARDLDRKRGLVRPTFEGDMVRTEPADPHIQPILVLPFANIQKVGAHQLPGQLEARRARQAAAQAATQELGGLTPLPLEPKPQDEVERHEPSLRIVQIGDALACPCGNDAKLGGCVNSTGEGAKLRAIGSTDARADDLELIIEQLPPRAIATLVMGSNAIQRPYGDGLLMVHNGGIYGSVMETLARFPVKTARNDGAISFGPGLAHYAAERFGERDMIQPGEVKFFQVIYRDVGGPCGSGMNATNALAVSFE